MLVIALSFPVSLLKRWLCLKSCVPNELFLSQDYGNRRSQYLYAVLTNYIPSGQTIYPQAVSNSVWLLPLHSVCVFPLLLCCVLYGPSMRMTGIVTHLFVFS